MRDDVALHAGRKAGIGHHMRRHPVELLLVADRLGLRRLRASADQGDEGCWPDGESMRQLCLVFNYLPAR